MKHAISTDGDFVSAHFGRCPHFTIVSVEGGEVRSAETIPNPGHHPGFLPQYLHERGVECIVAGGMGPRAQQLFAEKGIGAVLGVEGRVADVIDRLRRGELTGGASMCSPGAGKGYGIEKTECDHGERPLDIP
ncbi:MAG: NifB/NifX family molybdenum-iron cluster-binding protein [bacterium]|nr:NifB/NifX family molybdenum-iron cluster-binding protein [bacterium]